jgi:cytidine deaminase
MHSKEIRFTLDEYDSIDELKEDDAFLLQQARLATADAYAPYSKFRVAAVARLKNGEIVKGTNQENASFPVGICAERVLLSAVSSLYPNTAIDTIAVSYHNENAESNEPIAPCGICRQTLQEYEQRANEPVRLILGGETGKVLVIPQAGALLPLAFVKENLMSSL